MKKRGRKRPIKGNEDGAEVTGRKFRKGNPARRNLRNAEEIHGVEKGKRKTRDHKYGKASRKLSDPDAFCPEKPDADQKKRQRNDHIRGAVGIQTDAEEKGCKEIKPCLPSAVLRSACADGLHQSKQCEKLPEGHGVGIQTPTGEDDVPRSQGKNGKSCERTAPSEGLVQQQEEQKQGQHAEKCRNHADGENPGAEELRGQNVQINHDGASAAGSPGDGVHGPVVAVAVNAVAGKAEGFIADRGFVLLQSVRKTGQIPHSEKRTEDKKQGGSRTEQSAGQELIHTLQERKGMGILRRRSA